MTDLERLTVSLTKHNAHKIARLLKKYDAADLIGKLDEVHADKAQARKNLSVLRGDILPLVWEKVQSLGPDTIDALVLIAIIFSHYKLIKAMANASERDQFTGRVDRGIQLKDKAYTNFVQIIDQLGYATKREFSGVTFNLKGMFELPGLGPLVGELLELKLKEAGWDRRNAFSEEVARLALHLVFGVSADEFKVWITKGVQPASAQSNLLVKDQAFFQDESEGASSKKFEFKAGHSERDVEPVLLSTSCKSIAYQLHNDIQNKLYSYLKEKFGAPNVGTEVDTGSGTSVDVVTRHEGKVTFYEIKTGTSVRSNIRQALPQLLEYAYWPDEKRAHELIIVSHLPITPSAKKYLCNLKSKFDIPILYKQFDLSKNIII